MTTVYAALTCPKFAQLLDDALRSAAMESVGARVCTEPDAIAAQPDCVVYLPADTGGLPDTDSAQRFLQHTIPDYGGKIVLISSAAIYGAHHHNPGLISEDVGTRGKDVNPVVESWRNIESAFRNFCAQTHAQLTILRPASVHGVGSPINLLTTTRIKRPWGLNPTVQILSAADLARATICAIKSDSTGVFNIAPTHAALLSEVARAKFPKRRAKHGIPRPFFRHSWTVSGSKAQRELAFEPLDSTLESVGLNSQSATDAFGLSHAFIAWFGRYVVRFFEKLYWRVEVRGLENIPTNGRAVLTGVHRGFMPFDGVMLVHLLSQHRQRIPRFLIHPALVKFPFIAKLMWRFGGIIACQPNASRVLESNEILGIFPEGIRGAFSLRRDAYQLGRYWRDDFARFAIDYDAPVIPVALVGTADMFPILKKVKWGWFKRQTEWPFLPITPTFPLLPIPLPTRWHIEILPAVYPKQISGQPVSNAAELSELVRQRLQASIDGMVENRPSVFFGSAFPADTSATSPRVPDPISGKLEQVA